MATAPESTTGSKGRKRGGPLRINREQIVEAARRLDPQTLTMQAVANELGVDRKALNYHVTDRDGLVRLMAATVFESTSAEAFRAQLEQAGTSTGPDWRAAIRTWATTVRDSVVATGVVGDHFSLGTDSVLVLQPAEFVLRQLLRAGFDLATAGRALTLATTLGRGVGRDNLLLELHGEDPQATEVRELLAREGDVEGYDAFRGLVALGINGPEDIDAQFDFELDLLIAGLEQRLGQ